MHACKCFFEKCFHLYFWIKGGSGMEQYLSVCRMCCNTTVSSMRWTGGGGDQYRHNLSCLMVQGCMCAHMHRGITSRLLCDCWFLSAMKDHVDCLSEQTLH